MFVTHVRCVQTLQHAPPSPPAMPPLVPVSDMSMVHAGTATSAGRSLHGAWDRGVEEWWGVADWFQVVSQDVEACVKSEAGLVLERQQLLAQVEQLRHDLEQQQHLVLAREKVKNII
jgi:hypothetical protein